MERPQIQEYSYLQERLKRAASLTIKTPDKRGNSRFPRRVDRLDYLPTYPIQVSDTPPMEKFVLLVEKVKAYKLSEKNVTAKRLLSHSVSLARKLDEELPGNDGAVKFFYEGMQFLNETNPELAEDISRIMQKVYDEDRFDKKR